jgi:hypothetical protein
MVTYQFLLKSHNVWRSIWPRHKLYQHKGLHTTCYEKYIMFNAMQWPWPLSMGHEFCMWHILRWSCVANYLKIPSCIHKLWLRQKCILLYTYTWTRVTLFTLKITSAPQAYSKMSNFFVCFQQHHQYKSHMATYQLYYLKAMLITIVFPEQE